MAIYKDLAYPKPKVNQSAYLAAVFKPYIGFDFLLLNYIYVPYTYLW